MYSKENEPVCGLCLHSGEVKGIATHVSCSKRGGYMPKSRTGCTDYKYDIFKRKVKRKKSNVFEGFSPEDFTL